MMKVHNSFYWKIGQVLLLVTLAFALVMLWKLPDHLARAQPAQPGIEEKVAAQYACSNTPVTIITVGNTPRGVALDSTRHRVYVANNGSNTVSVIDTTSNTVIQTITNTLSANGIAYDSTNNIIWVTNQSTNQVTPILANTDATSFTVESPISVGSEPWGVAYEPVHNYVYVVNNGSDSVSVINAGSRTLVATLSGGNFGGPYHIAANPNTGKAYVANFISNTITILNGTSVSKVIDLNPGLPSTQPYGVAVDETRDIVYVTTVNSQRIVAIGNDPIQGPDTHLGWALFYRGGGGVKHLPLPMRSIAINPDIGPSYDGGHVWTTTSTADGSMSDQVLLIPKGWAGYFHYATPNDMSSPILGEGIVVDRTTDLVYATSGGSPGTVTVWADSDTPCLRTASVEEQVDLIAPKVFSSDATPLFNADVTEDGAVDILDLSFIASRYGTNNPVADINDDGEVDIFDLVLVAGRFGD
jgi:YVTN family beta-propeller protein